MIGVGLGGAPSQIVDVVTADLGTTRPIALAGATSSVIVFAIGAPGHSTRIACDRTTGARVTEPVLVEPAPRPGDLPDLVLDGVGVAIRPRGARRELVRVHGDGWHERVTLLGETATVVTTDAHVLALDHVDDGLVASARLVGYLSDARGAVVTIPLPAWLVRDDEQVTSEPRWHAVALAAARVIVVMTSERAAWLTYEAIAALHAAAPAIVKLRATVPQSGGDGHAVVTREGSRGAVVEGATGKRVMLSAQRVPVDLGERLTVTAIDGVYALVNARGELVAREDKIELVRTVDAHAGRYPHLDARLTVRATRGAHARGLVAPGVQRRLAQLRALGIAPGLEGAALDAAITDVLGDAHTARSATLVAAAALYAHLRATPEALSPERALVDTDAIERASHGNAELSAAGVTRRWHLVMMPDHEPFALCLEPDTHTRLVAEDLLALEPVPACVAPANDGETVRRELAQLLGCGATDVVLEPVAGNHVALRLSLHAAAMLAERLAYARR